MIDGDRWIAQRLAFLEGLLQTDLTEEHRAAVESEIAALSKERGIHHGGHRWWWFPRRLLRRSAARDR